MDPPPKAGDVDEDVKAPDRGPVNVTDDFDAQGADAGRPLLHMPLSTQ
jgi:hypothetical protein